ncbi:sugar ABC transporter ATP-binding protein [Clostridia bacterium]|nr:sugar ABC transporter ATP-binding protein [Clostridia bacterium]
MLKATGSDSSGNESAAIELRNITKRFGSVLANDRVSLSAQKGEILSILGENGSGKTTLMNMISGIYFPDEGQIFVEGREVRITSPKDAFALGIGMVHQHFKLVEVLSAAENIILGLPGKLRLSLEQIEKEVAELAESYGFVLDPKQKIYEMSVSQRQTVEIVKVLYRGAKILILDEPTAVLTPQEADTLFTILRKMREDGKSILIITHKLNEVLALSDRVSVLRKGAYVGTVKTKEATARSLTEMMVGEKVRLDIVRPAPKEPKKRLVVSELSCVDKEGLNVLTNVSFAAYGGEILGIAGIAGSGQKELLEAIAGLQAITSGSIDYFPPNRGNEETDKANLAKSIPTDKTETTGKTNEKGLDLVGLKPEEIKSLGIRLSFVPEDRLGMGLVPDMDLTDNMLLRSLHDEKGFLVDRKKPKKLALSTIDRLSVSVPGVSTPVRRLSGGNVQKILVGREIAGDPKVLMVAYPVRGLDIRSAHTIYDLLNKQKEKGVALLCVGEDLDVLLALCDKIMVLSDGKMSEILDAKQTDKEAIGLLMMGDGVA